MDIELVVDVLGWIGVAALLVAYGLVSARKLDGGSFPYQILNLLGSALLILNSLYYGAYPSVGINIAWIAIALISISQIIRKARQPTDQ